MYIDTHTINKITSTVLDLLDVNEQKFILFLDNITNEFKINSSFDGYKFDDFINNYIHDHCDLSKLTHVQFYHLSRRLNDSLDSYEGKNLKTLLLEDTKMKDFFSKNCISFYEKGRFIGIEYKGKEVNLEDTSKKGACYLRSRLGYNKEQDFCFNGFMFKDLLYSNSYARSLSSSPEFIQNLASFLNDDNLICSYKKESKYFCYEYLVPIEKVIIDKRRKTYYQKDKARYLIRVAIKRIIKYKNNPIEYNRCTENELLMLNDYINLDSKYFIRKEEITNEMLR